MEGRVFVGTGGAVVQIMSKLLQAWELPPAVWTEQAQPLLS